VYSRKRELRGHARGMAWWDGGGPCADPPLVFLGGVQILQLYVAAYQNPVIWKLVWKDLVGVISVQIVRDVEAFVTRYPFADAEVMRFMVAS